MSDQAPATEAGRRLVDTIAGGNLEWRLQANGDVLAIEAEARASLDVDVLAALTSENEIAHGEAVFDRGASRVQTGRCAYCDDEWPCRTQRGIDRLLAILAETVR